MADTPKVYVMCDANCKWEGMTKEQILTAIAQAVNNGQITNLDTGFITTIKTINGVGLKFFVGEQHEYEALTAEQKENLFAIITNDTVKEGILNTLEDHTTQLANAAQYLGQLVEIIWPWHEGTGAVPKAATLTMPKFTSAYLHEAEINGVVKAAEVTLESNTVYMVYVYNTDKKIVTHFVLPVGEVVAGTKRAWLSTVGSGTTGLNAYFYRGVYWHSAGGATLGASTFQLEYSLSGADKFTTSGGNYYVYFHKIGEYHEPDFAEFDFGPNM